MTVKKNQVSNFIEKPASKKSLAFKKPVCGVGVNDANYITESVIDGERVRCPYHRTWDSMLRRCYSASYQEKQPTYKECIVVNEWLRFSNFKTWMVNQDWQGKVLDKDILEPGNKIYSPTKCVFVTTKVNNLLTDRKARSGHWPQGVGLGKQKAKFEAQCCVKGKQKSLGYFSTAEEAAAKYNVFKAKEITRIAYLQTDVRIRDGLLRHAKNRRTIWKLIMM